MPVFIKDSVVPTDNRPSMVAWYRLEISSIAVNLAQRKFDSYRTGKLYISFTVLCDGRTQIFHDF